MSALGAVLDALDHALLRAGVRVAGRHQRRADDGAKDAGRTRALPVHARPVADRSSSGSCLDGRHVCPGGIDEVGGQILVSMQVIWAIGASMVVLAGAQLLGQPGLPCASAHSRRRPQPARSDLAGDRCLSIRTGRSGSALHSQMSVSVGPFLFAVPVSAAAVDRRDAVRFWCGDAVRAARQRRGTRRC